MAVKDAITTILNRNSFYRDGYRLLIKISIVQALVIVVLVFCIIALATTVQTRQIYFATTSDGRILSLIPLNEPFKQQAEVISWASSASHSIMQFGYMDYKDKLQEVSGNFTQAGWETFSKALKEANIIDAIVQKKWYMTMEIEAAPEIKQEGISNGIYTWYLKFPVTIKYEGTDAPTPTRLSLLLKIVRVSTLVNPEGISIDSWIALTNKDN